MFGLRFLCVVCSLFAVFYVRRSSCPKKYSSLNSNRNYYVEICVSSFINNNKVYNEFIWIYHSIRLMNHETTPNKQCVFPVLNKVQLLCFPQTEWRTGWNLLPVSLKEANENSCNIFRWNIYDFSLFSIYLWTFNNFYLCQSVLSSVI